MAVAAASIDASDSRSIGGALDRDSRVTAAPRCSSSSAKADPMPPPAPMTIAFIGVGVAPRAPLCNVKQRC